jgi:hypothetical protein
MLPTIRYTVLILLLAVVALPAHAQWAMRVENDATVTITYNKTAVVRVIYVAWVEDWKWANTDTKVSRATDAGVPFVGRVLDLGLTWKGTITQPTPSVVQMHYQFSAAAARTKVMGSGLEFQVRTDLPELAGSIGRPTALPNKKGWQWKVGEDAFIRVTAANAFADVYFDKGRRERPRTMFYSGTVGAGNKEMLLTIALPEAEFEDEPATETYGDVDADSWYRNVLADDGSPVDLSFLNAADRPAGSRGFVKVRGDALVFADGSPARFWGANIAAAALFVPEDDIQRHAVRLAKLGCNVVRIHHHDSAGWVRRTVIDKSKPHSRDLDAEVMDRLDLWIHELKKQGIYVWLDLHVGRLFKDGDGIEMGWPEIRMRGKPDAAGAEIKGFNYFNPGVQALMLEFNRKYLTHVNPYTKLAYADDPAVIGVLLTNENDITQHYGAWVRDTQAPIHAQAYIAAARAFAESANVRAEDVLAPDPSPGSRMFLSDREFQFFRALKAALPGTTTRIPAAATNVWGKMSLPSLPSLTAGDMVDAHVYGGEDELATDPRARPNWLSWPAAAQVYGMPMTISEWNITHPQTDRFIGPLAIMGMASLQGWDAAMLFTYSQRSFKRPTLPQKWTTYYDPAVMAMMPAAAVAYREQHFREALKTYCYIPSADDLFAGKLSPATAAALRTVAEQSRLTVGFPEVPVLPWLTPTKPAADVETITDATVSLLPKNHNFVASDTDEIKRYWQLGIQTFQAARSEAAQGWIGDKTVRLGAVTMEMQTAKAAVAVTSLDGAPIVSSERLLISAVARAVADPERRAAFISEPVIGRMLISSGVPGMRLVPLVGDHIELDPLPVNLSDGAYTVELPAGDAETHWYLLKTIAEAP